MILSFDKPKKLRSTEEHNQMHSSDSGIAGTYVSNMSKQDMLKWKAKKIGGDDPRVEIRKTVVGKDQKGYHHSAQILLVVRPDGIKMSSNGSMIFTHHIWCDMGMAVEEAKEILLEMSKQAG